MTTVPGPVVDSRPRSRAEHRERVQSAPLVMGLTQTIEVRTDIDLVSHFAAFNETDQDSYWAADLSDDGLDAEWQRPLAYLLLCAEVEVEEPFLGDYTAISTVDEPVLRDRVVRRNAIDVTSLSGRWSQADYQALIASVEWMRPEGTDVTALIADVARQPGPHDDPAFWGAP